MPEPENHEYEHRRGPVIAAMLSILTAGLGQVYAGRFRRGVLALLILWASVALWLILSMRIDSPAFRVGAFLAVLGVWLGVLVDAVRLARRAPPDFEPRRYNRALVYAGIVLAVAFVFQPLVRAALSARVARAISLPGESMSPTLRAGDNLYMSPGLDAPPARGDPVVWRDSSGSRFILRVVALAGDTVEMRQKVLSIDGTPVAEPYVLHIDQETDPSDPRMDWQRAYLAHPEVTEYRPSRDRWGPIVVPGEHVLLLGDNRDNSFDGRYLGPVHESAIVGRPVWIYFSRDPSTGRIRWDRIGASVR